MGTRYVLLNLHFIAEESVFFQWFKMTKFNIVGREELHFARTIKSLPIKVSNY